MPTSLFYADKKRDGYGDNATFVEALLLKRFNKSTVVPITIALAAEAATKAGSDLQDALIVAMTAVTGQVREFVVTKDIFSDLPEAIPEGDSDDYNLNKKSSDDSGQHEADSPDSNTG